MFFFVKKIRVPKLIFVEPQVFTQKLNMKKFFFLSVVLGLVIYACEIEDNEQGNSPSNPTLFNIHLTDAPNNYDAVNVDLQQVIVKGNGGTDSVEMSTIAGIYNLLDFQNGVDTLIANTVLTVDTIKQVRLVLGENNTIEVAGDTFDLKTPSAQQSGLKIPLNIPVADLDQYDLTLDFDAMESVIETGNGQYILRPVIKVVE